jgi:ribosomal protein S18 acetylase RimI-like enzyme
LVADQGGVAVGFVQLYPLFSSVSLGPIYVLNDLFVDPKARGQGAGGRLLEAARAYGEHAGAHYLELSTAVDNPAQRLYEAWGWVLDREFLYYELMLPRRRESRSPGEGVTPGRRERSPKPERTPERPSSGPSRGQRGRLADPP